VLGSNGKRKRTRGCRPSAAYQMRKLLELRLCLNGSCCTKLHLSSGTVARPAAHWRYCCFLTPLPAAAATTRRTRIFVPQTHRQRQHQQGGQEHEVVILHLVIRQWQGEGESPSPAARLLLGGALKSSLRRVMAVARAVLAYSTLACDMSWLIAL